MTFFAILPPLPLEARFIFGLLGTAFAGILNLVFRKAAPRWWQFAVALAMSPTIIWRISFLGENSGQRTPYVFWGAIVGIVCIRGKREPSAIPSFGMRAAVVVAAFVLLGPLVGLGFHFLGYLAGKVYLNDDWEISLSLQDGTIASVVGAILAAILIVGSMRAGQKPRAAGWP